MLKWVSLITLLEGGEQSINWPSLGLENVPKSEPSGDALSKASIM